MNYLDFDLEIGPGDGREYPVTLLRSPAGEARTTMVFPFDKIKLRLNLVELENALLRSATTHRLAPTKEEQEVLKFGSTLFDAVFTNEIRNRFEVSLERAQMQDKGLRIKLRVNAPELTALPWEFLFDPRRGEYLCFSRQTPIVRYTTLPLPVKPLRIEPPLRILGMIASPRNLPQLDVTVEKERLDQPLRNLQQTGLVELHWLEGQSWRDLQRVIRHGPWHVFHFIGHGGFDASREEGFLAFCDERGERVDFRATHLARLLTDHKALRLVILNACEGARSSQQDIFSSTASILLRGGIPAVLAMQYAITDLAAVEFARTFYEALADGMPVDSAVAEGRVAISLAFADTIEWGTPVLYLRAEDGVLFDVYRQTGPAVPPDEEKTVITPVIPESSREQEAALRRLYEDGLSAYYLKDWQRARHALVQVIQHKPDHADAVEKLRDVEEQLELARLYDQATACIEVQDWQAAQPLLTELEQRSPDYKDVPARLVSVRTQIRLEELYTDAQHLNQVGKYPAVIEIFDEIHTLDAHFPDRDGLLPAARAALEEAERQNTLSSTYTSALQAIGSGKWKTARNLLEQVEKIQPNYRDTGDLLVQVNENLAIKSRPTSSTVTAATKFLVANRKVLARVALGVILLIILVSFIGSAVDYVQTELARSNSPSVSTQPSYLPLRFRFYETDGMEMVYVPEGEFQMGCDPEQNLSKECSNDEIPLHSIYLDAFWIDKTEITNQMYSRCVDRGECREPAHQDSTTRGNYYNDPALADYPVINVSWEDAEAYCAWAGRRLPTEAEWEKAARGSMIIRIFPWGDRLPDCELANFKDCGGDTNVVGSYVDGVSPYGALDMAGNVWEWVSDWYGRSYYSLIVSPSNPTGPGGGNSKVLRGGSWAEDSSQLLVSNRFYLARTKSGYNVGFRCTASP